MPMAPASRLTFGLFTLLALGACASGGQRGEGQAPARVDVTSQTERILADARKKKAETSCAQAIPSYRVVASFGKGHDTAQFELGSCLLETAAAKPGDPLLIDEGLFWLRRAAYAGNARAQIALATALSGAQVTGNNTGHNTEHMAAAGITPDMVEAFGWSLIYADNAAHNLYGLPDLNPLTADHFTTAMTPAMVDAAEEFAASFATVEMDVFIPPVFEGRERRGQQAGQPGGRGDDRRRR